MTFVLEDKYIGRYLPSNRENDNINPLNDITLVPISYGPPQGTEIGPAPQPPPPSEEVEIGSARRPPPRSEGIEIDPDIIELEE